MPHALVMRAPGTNCDSELCRAFELAGATVSLVHIDRLLREPGLLEETDIFAVAGGFSYGDDVASGRIVAMRMRARLYPALREAARRGGLMFGVCNGFQIFAQAGLLPGPDGAGGAEWPDVAPPAQSVALTFNAGGRFIDGWYGVRAVPESVCVWTRGLAEAYPASIAADVLKLPIAHGEGRFVAAPEVMSALRRHGQIALEAMPGENANGSEGGVVGICDPSGRIFGLMPHPERYLDWNRHPYWTRLDRSVLALPTPGMLMFRNAVAAVQGAAAGR
ncbi:MAG: phosphoribosylformylglycinamidine synthase subunit PurQ [Phycisphaerales bacterium]